MLSGNGLRNMANSLALPANATFCDARAATIAVADPVDTENVADAWDEVGIDAVLCSE